jgi:hypothetical protein
VDDVSEVVVAAVDDVSAFVVGNAAFVHCQCC